MGASKTSNHIQIKIKMPNPSQEPQVSSKAPNEDLMDMDVLCTFKTKMREPEIGTLVYHLQIKIKMKNPSQEPPSSSKAQNEDLTLSV